MNEVRSNINPTIRVMMNMMTSGEKRKNFENHQHQVTFILIQANIRSQFTFSPPLKIARRADGLIILLNSPSLFKGTQEIVKKGEISSQNAYNIEEDDEEEEDDDDEDLGKYDLWGDEEDKESEKDCPRETTKNGNNLSSKRSTRPRTRSRSRDRRRAKRSRSRSRYVIFCRIVKYFYLRSSSS